MSPHLFTVALTCLMAGCADEPLPLPPKPPVVIAHPSPIKKAQVVLPAGDPVLLNAPVPDVLVAPPGSEASKAIRRYRIEENGAKRARSYPGYSKGQIRELDEAERGAHNETQHLIDQDGHATTRDVDDAHGAINRLHDAQSARPEDAPVPDAGK